MFHGDIPAHEGNELPDGDHHSDMALDVKLVAMVLMDGGD